jgi:hypothetical protein
MARKDRHTQLMGRDDIKAAKRFDPCLKEQGIEALRWRLACCMGSDVRPVFFLNPFG